MSSGLNIPYSAPRFLTQPLGNNAFSYEERSNKILRVASLHDGSFDDLRVGTIPVFEDLDAQWVLCSCTGLENFVRTDWQGIPVTVFDNHNHALYFLCDALGKEIISAPVTLIHVDQHADLRENIHTLDRTRLQDREYLADFVDTKTNVGNYLPPLLRANIISQVIRVEGTSALVALEYAVLPDNFVLDLDLDFFAPELDFIDKDLKFRTICRLARHAKAILIATSPFFMDQNKAIAVIWQLFRDEIG